MRKRRVSLFWPLVLIGLGVLVLLQNFGWLPAGLWAALAQLWPVLLIVLGADMLLGRRTSADRFTVLLAGGMLVTDVVLCAAFRAQQPPPEEPQAIIQTTLGVEALETQIEFRAGALHVSALGRSDHAMEGQVRHSSGETLQQYFAVWGGTGRLYLEQAINPLFVPFLAGRETTADWEVKLTPQLPLALLVDAGQGQAELDLTGLDLTRLALNAGAGRADVTFPAEGRIEARISQGAGTLTLAIPRSLPARITVHSGLDNVRIPARFTQAGSIFTTPDFNLDGDYLDLTLEAGAGQVRVR